MPLDIFQKYMLEASKVPDIVEIAISTRPDCIREDYLDVLNRIRETTGIQITIELGLQTAADLITRLSAIFYTYCGSHKFVQKKLLLLQKLGILNLHNRKNHVFAKFYACTSPGFWL